MDEDDVITPDEIQEVAPEIEEAETEEVEASAIDDGDGESFEDGDDTGEDAGESEDDGEPEEAETVEIKLGGDALEVPKGTIPEEVVTQIEEKFHNLEAGATRKFQEASEIRKQVETRAEAVDKIGKVSGEQLLRISQAIAARGEVERLQAINLNALRQSNPDEARWVSDDLARKTAEFQQLELAVAQGEQQIEQQQAQETQRLFEEGVKVVEKRIPGFKEKHLNEVLDYAVNTLGIDRAEAEAGWALNPSMAETTFKAMKYDQLQSKANKVAKPKTQKAKPVTAMKGAGGKTVPNDPSSMSMEQYVAHRKKQEAARA